MTSLCITQISLSQVNDGRIFLDRIPSFGACTSVTMAGYFESMQKFFQTNNKTKEYQVHSAKVHSVAWNCDGKRLASGSFDKTVVAFVFDRGDRLVSSVKCHCDGFPYLLHRSTAEAYPEIWIRVAWRGGGLVPFPPLGSLSLPVLSLLLGHCKSRWGPQGRSQCYLTPLDSRRPCGTYL